MTKSIFYQGRRPKLAGCPLVDLARLPIKPAILARFAYCPGDEPDQAAVDRFVKDVIDRMRREYTGATNT